jgi:hypothetical protein
MGKARELLQNLQRTNAVTRLDERRMGLEGETRLCVEFKDSAAAASALKELRGIAEGVELLNVTEEPCAKP